MNNIKNKYHHFTYSERVKLEYHLNLNIDCTAVKLAKILGKDRRAIYYELKHHVVNEKPSDEYKCEILKRFPFCCNNCVKVKCTHRNYTYSAYEADKKARYTLVNSRFNLEKRNKTVNILNRSVCPLIKDGLSIEVAKNNVNNCDVSNQTIRRYIEAGLVNAKRHNLPRASRFRAKKEYDYSKKAKPLPVNILNGRTYDDYKKYMDAYPKSKVVQLDSVIGKLYDQKAILTIYFTDTKLQLGRIYYRNKPHTVNIMRQIHKIGIDNNIKLFDVILADNGSEFKDLYELEFDEEGNRICHVFYCDPYRSCQKAECEKNHGLFRRIVPKGNSFKDFSQKDVDTIFSHINSYPRASLNNRSPYDLFSLGYSLIILTLFNVYKVAIKDLRMRDYKGWL